ncbi:MAG: T9SS type A sorting domain-containing protein [Patescibacteria group bacterium]
MKTVFLVLLCLLVFVSQAESSAVVMGGPIVATTSMSDGNSICILTSNGEVYMMSGVDPEPYWLREAADDPPIPVDSIAFWECHSFTDIAGNGWRQGGPTGWYIYPTLWEATAVEEIPDSKNIVFQVYPNPFNSVVNISYNVPSQSHVSLKIFNVKGELVENLIDKEQNSDNYQCPWNSQKMASGVYFAQLICGEQIKTRKIVLLR